MQRFNLKDLAIHSLTGGVVGGGLAVLLAINEGLPGWAPVVPVGLTLLYVGFRMRRYFRRLRGGDEPPEAIREALETKVLFYRRLDSEAEKARFRRDVHWFLLDQHIEGVGVEADASLRALVAASAVVLSFGRPWYEWDTTRDILLYPSAFDEHYKHDRGASRLGQVSSQGPVILSAEALRAGFARGTDGHNVGFHEFAHVLDFDDGEVDGIPANLNWEAIRPWVDQMSGHLFRAGRRGGYRKALRQYAYTNEAEFFACATEMFFEQPALLKKRAPALYDILVGFYAQSFLGSEDRGR